VGVAEGNEVAGAAGIGVREDRRGWWIAAHFS